MRIKKIRLLACLLLMGLVMGYKTPIYAALPNEPIKIGSSAKTLTALTLTGMDEPVLGVPFDTSATIVTAEGVTWDIPVIWVDEYGNRVTVPVIGKKYYPAFVFYVPAGYQVADVNATGAFEIRLPDFVKELVGPEGLVFAADPANGITYVLPVNGVPADFGKLLPKPSTAPVSEPEQAVQASYFDVETEPATAPASVPFVSAKVRMYCADSAINTLGNEFLEGFIDLLKNTLVPEAANLLREKFPQSFGSAVPGTELSSNIGLYIYYLDGEIMGEPAPSSALAFNFSNASEDKLTNILGFDASSFTEYDEGTGLWKVSDYQKANLDNTVIHELLHSFMFDYTRYGMFIDPNNESQGYPLWFKEGVASAVENVYMYRIHDFLQFSGASVFEAFHSPGIEWINPDYSTQNVLNAYQSPYMTTEGAYFFTPGDVDPEDFILDMTQDGTSSYVSGYLAVAYLGYMDALHNGETPIDAGGSINVDVIRGGVDDVIKRLHGTDSMEAQSLDAIIQEISGQRYQDTDDFAAKFIKGSVLATGEYSGDTNDDGTGSLTFVSTYLTWLDSQSNIMEWEFANGSLLSQRQDYSSPLDWDRTESSGVYQIPDQGGMIVSSVGIERANLTGGKGSVGDGTQNYMNSNSDEDEEMASAARTENTLTFTPEEETADISVTETEETEESVGEQIPDTEPVTDYEEMNTGEVSEDTAQAVPSTDQDSENTAEFDDSDTTEQESPSEEESESPSLTE